MPRRAGGKAASRRARQRSAQRSAQRATRSAPQPAAVPPVGTPDAREAVALDPPRRVSAPVEAVGDSRLSGHEQAEYHYVERDLRNVGILTAAMFALLVVAWFALSALGVTS